MENPSDKTPWFASWFDSPYYPILYQHRDYEEAERFIDHLLQSLAPATGSHVLDLACGRGRHSIYINKAGHTVTGIDLSPESIADARKSATEGLDFLVGDMRDDIPGNYNYIFNLFTSFGYFDDPKENLEVLHNIRRALKPGGTLVLDFMNAEKAIAGMVAEEEKILNGIRFGIRKHLQDADGVRHIIKDIHVMDGEHEFHFQERVQALGKADFEALFAAAGLDCLQTWGDYDGGAFDLAISPRLISFCKLSPTFKPQTP